MLPDHGPGYRVQHRQAPARRPGGSLRLRRGRARRHPGRPHRRSRTGYRHRHRKHRLDAAAALGATDTINAAEKTSAEAVIAASGGGVDHAIEAVGLPETAAQALCVLRPGGQAVIAGMTPPDTDIRIPGRLLRHGRTIRGTVMGGVRTRADIPRYAALVTRNTQNR